MQRSTFSPPLSSALETAKAPSVPLGQNWPNNNLWWNGFVARGAAESEFSPLNGDLIQTVHVLSPPDLSELFEVPASLPAWSEADVLSFAIRLEARLNAQQAVLREAVQLETAFSNSDCDEIIAGGLQYLRGFAEHFATLRSATPVLGYNNGEVERQISLKSNPWGTIAVMLPHNAFLFLGAVCLLNALITGNRVVFRAPVARGRTAALLAAAIWEAKPPQESVAMVVAKGRDFLDAAYGCPSPALIHYLGASNYGGDILSKAFQSGKSALIDGTGNTWVWVGAQNDAHEIAEMLTRGATRYNGQTCTSINGAIIHPVIFESVCALLQARWALIQVGNKSQGAMIGGLFDEAQAQFCHERIQSSGGKLLCGGQVSGNRLEPTLVREPSLDSKLVKEGIFGPILWLRAGTREDFVQQWSSNRYQLCAGVMERDVDEEWWLKRLPQLARLVLNGDPSSEYIYEPWGGYASAGANSVSFWHQKYERTVSVDAKSSGS